MGLTNNALSRSRMSLRLYMSKNDYYRCRPAYMMRFSLEKIHFGQKWKRIEANWNSS